MSCGLALGVGNIQTYRGLLSALEEHKVIESCGEKGFALDDRFLAHMRAFAKRRPFAPADADTWHDLIKEYDFNLAYKIPVCFMWAVITVVESLSNQPDAAAPA